MNIIAITGKARSGKSTVANILQRLLTKKLYSKEGFIENIREPLIVSLADPLKELVSVITGVSVEDMDRKFKTKPIQNSSLWKLKKNDLEVSYNAFKGSELEDKMTIIKPTGREILQQTGDFIRSLNPNFFVEKILNKTYPRDIDTIIIPDLRFKNEYYTLMKFGNVSTIRVKSIHCEKSSHKSETDLDNIEMDFTIENNSKAMDVLEQTIRENILNKLSDNRLLITN